MPIAASAPAAASTERAGARRLQALVPLLYRGPGAAGVPDRRNEELPCAPRPRSSPPPSVNRSCCYGGIFDRDTAVKRLAELNQRAEDPRLWSAPQTAQ